MVINSDTHKRVADSVEYALLEASHSVLIITHKTLLDIDPSYLQDWVVVIDEVPAVANNLTREIGDHAFSHFLEGFIELDGETNRASIKPGMTREARSTYSDVVDDKGFSTIAVCLGALLRGKADVYINSYEDKKDSRWKWRVRVIDYFDLSGIYESAQETHILAANIVGTLAYRHALTMGYDIAQSAFTPGFRRYITQSYIHPLLFGSKVSKTMLLTMPDGSVSEEWNSSVLGHWLIERVLSYIDGEPILIQVHDWCKFPFEEHPNAIRIPFDARGLNTYTHVFNTLSLIHGNPNPIEDRNNSEMLTKMEVDSEAGKLALRNERYRELILQAATRSGIRTFTNTQHTVHFVPTEESARHLAFDLCGNHIITKEITIHPPMSNSKEGLANKITQAHELAAQGLSARKIGIKMGVSNSTVSQWLKQYALQAEATCQY